MIVRTLHDIGMHSFLGKMRAKTMVKYSDRVGYVLFDVVFDQGEELLVHSPFTDCVHTQAHYYIHGSGRVLLNNEDYNVHPDTMIALDGCDTYTLHAYTPMRAAYVYFRGAKAETNIVRSLREIVGTDRDVFWGNGQSRRFLTKVDRMGFALCNTSGNSFTNSTIVYNNHFESCYYLEGSGEYEWESGRHPVLTGPAQGTVFIMNNHDKHYMRIAEKSICLSIFNPPIEGHECHNFGKGNFSSY